MIRKVFKYMKRKLSIVNRQLSIKSSIVNRQLSIGLSIVNCQLSIFLLSCSDEGGRIAPEADGATGEITFSLSTRASADEVFAAKPIGDEQSVRLFVVERKQEHSGIGNDTGDNTGPTFNPDLNPMSEPLHVERMVDLTDGSYRLTELFGQWYKFAFVCVPNVDEATGTAMLYPALSALEKEHDYADCYIDYTAALEYQAAYLNAAQEKDMAIYRAAIDRWIDLGVEGGSEEDVYLTRQTGELVLDMGIPEDQFDTQYDETTVQPTCPVAYYEIKLHTPTSMYVRDEARDEVIISSVTPATGDPITFRWEVTGQKERQKIHIALLPDVKRDPATGTLNEGDSGTDPAEPEETDDRRMYYLSVQAFDEAGNAFSWKNAAGDVVDDEAIVLQDISEGIDRGIQVKKNVRTTVLFNGLTTGQFEVRYAGFNTNAVIDVDDDAWDGTN